MAVPEIKVKIGADVSGLEAGINKAAEAFNKLDDASRDIGAKLQVVGRQISDIGKSLSVVSAGVAAGAVGMFALANSSAKAGNAIDKSSKAVGLSTKAYQELEFAIGQVSDLTEGQMVQAMRQLNTRIGQAAEGSAPMIAAFAAIGVTQDELTSGTIDTEQAFVKLTAAAQASATPQEAAAIAGRLLGEEAGKLGPILRESGDQMDALRARAHELGNVMSAEAVAAAAEFTDAVDEVTRQIGAMKNELGAELMPVITDQLIPALQEHVVPAIREVISALVDVIKWFGDLPGPVQEAVAVMVGVFAVGGPIVVAIGMTITALGSILAFMGPAGLIAAAVIAGVAVWVKYGDAAVAALDRIIAKAKEVVQPLRQIFGGPLSVDANGMPGVVISEVRSAPQGAGIGANLADGILNGVTERMIGNAPALQSAIDQYVTGVAKETLGIESPSKVFHEIGNFLGIGMAQGIEESTALVASAAAGMGRAAAAEADASASSVLSAMGQLFEGSKKISAGIALANSWLAFTEVLKDPAFIGRPWARVAAASAALAQGLNAVRAIKSATSGGGGGGGGSAGAGGGGGIGQTITVDFQGPDWARQGFDQFIGQLNDFTRRGGRIEGVMMA